MTLPKTEKKHWVNGHQLRGGWCNTFNISLLSLGVMISWGGRKPITIDTYHLI